MKHGTASWKPRLSVPNSTSPGCLQQWPWQQALQELGASVHRSTENRFAAVQFFAHVDIPLSCDVRAVIGSSSTICFWGYVHLRLKWHVRTTGRKIPVSPWNKNWDKQHPVLAGDLQGGVSGKTLFKAFNAAHTDDMVVCSSEYSWIGSLSLYTQPPPSPSSPTTFKQGAVILDLASSFFCKDRWDCTQEIMKPLNCWYVQHWKTSPREHGRTFLCFSMLFC